MSSCTKSLICLVFIVWVSPLAAQWTTVGTGIEYQQFTAPGPNDCFVARMQRNNPICGIDSTIGSGALYSGRETVSGQAARYDEAIGYWGDTWGTRQDVVVAINGDFFNTTTGMPTGGQIQGGWYCKRFPEFGGWAGMAAKIDGSYFMGACVNNPAAKQIVHYLGTGSTANFNGINTTRASGDLIIYTHHYDSTTHTDNSGAEVLVQMDAPLQIGALAEQGAGHRPRGPLGGRLEPHPLRLHRALRGEFEGRRTAGQRHGGQPDRHLHGDRRLPAGV